MKRVVMALASTAVGLVLLLSFKSHSVGEPRSALAAGTSGGTTPGQSQARSGGTSGTSGTSGSRGTTGTAGKSGSSTARSGTYTGETVDTRFGPVQVAAVVKSGKLTDVQVLQETYGGRSEEIDAQAFPILKADALSKQTANVDVVSGATFTSQAYAQSLQSALDKAGL